MAAAAAAAAALLALGRLSAAQCRGLCCCLCCRLPQTGFTTDPRPKYNYEARRAALRASWVPPTQAALDRCERGAKGSQGGTGWRAVGRMSADAPCSSHWLALWALEHLCSIQQHDAPTRLPAHPPACLCRLEAEQGIVVRFVIGHSPDAAREAQVAAEEAEHGGFLRLPLTEGYAGLPTKTIMFLRVGMGRPWTPALVAGHCILAGWWGADAAAGCSFRQAMLRVPMWPPQLPFPQLLPALVCPRPGLHVPAGRDGAVRCAVHCQG